MCHLHVGCLQEVNLGYIPTICKLWAVPYIQWVLASHYDLGRVESEKELSPTYPKKCLSQGKMNSTVIQSGLNLPGFKSHIS